MPKYTSGQSGNPKGRPRGIVDKRVALRSMLEPHAAKLIAKVVGKALKGDTTALRICLDRLVPPVRAKDEPVMLNALAGGIAEQAKAVISAVAEARVTPDQAASLMATIASQARILEADELARRVAALEEKVGRQVGVLHGQP